MKAFDPAAPAPSGLPRGVEVGAAAVGLVVAAPILAIAAAAIVATTGRSPIFRQRRVGRSGRPFTLVKLTTMRRAPPGVQVTARGDARVTRVGRILRRTKIDELPQLWNVLVGDMSLVGPRPEVPRYVDPAQPLWAAVLRVRPGLTDPVTLRLRDEEELIAAAGGDPEVFYRTRLQPEKLRGYARYVERRSWRSDLGVLWATARAIVHPARSLSPSEIHALAEGLQPSPDV